MAARRLYSITLCPQSAVKQALALSPCYIFKLMPWHGGRGMHARGASASACITRRGMLRGQPEYAFGDPPTQLTERQAACFVAVLYLYCM